MPSIHRWSEEENSFLRKNIKGRLYSELLIMFEKKFDITITLTQLSSHIKKLGITSGVNTQFKKGLESYNKGKKMEIEIYSKCAPTMFKQGSKPKNTDQIGTEKILADGYVWVKIDDQPKVPKKVNWRPKHVKIWQDKHGPVPKGHVVIFLDGDRTNFDLDNLKMISQSTNARLNQNHMRHSDKAITEAGIAVAEVITTIASAKRRIGGK